jgi:hypothetical protein
MTAYRLPNDFPDHLAATQVAEASLPSPGLNGNRGWTRGERYATLGLLVLLCLVPRSFMAWKIGGLCPDAVVYIQVAKSFDKGLLHEGTHHRFGVNLYPVVLMLLHRLGLDWEMAGKLWNVMISCLTVLPLHGWVRRQFDDRVALTAGCLYAIHAEFIRSSPEGIRDPTFWFFMALALYLLWRAVTEVRLWLFLLGGLAVAMAVMTRSEGMFLLVPLGLWSFWRGRAPVAIAAGTPRKASAMRRKLVLGLILAVGVFPSLLALASLFWFRDNAPWELVRTYPLKFVELWIQAGLAKLSGHDATVSAAASVGWMKMLGLFASAMFKGMTPVFALFTGIGVAGWWRTWKRREHQAMFHTVLLFLLAIWIHMNVLEETSKRYFLPVALVMSPFAALGLLACCRQLACWAEIRSWGQAAGRLAAWTPLVLFGVFSLGNVLWCDYRQRAGQAELGRWTRQEFGPSPMLLGPNGAAQVVTYYSQGRYQPFAQDDNDRTIEDLIRQRPYDIVLLPEQREAVRGGSDLLRQAASLGYRPIEGKPFSDKVRNMVVLARQNSAGGSRE